MGIEISGTSGLFNPQSLAGTVALPYAGRLLKNLAQPKQAFLGQIVAFAFSIKPQPSTLNYYFTF